MAVRKIETRLEIDGEKQFKEALKSVDSELKNLKSELAVVSSEFRENENSMEALSAKGRILKQSYDQQEEKVRALNQAFEAAKTVYGENSKQADDYRRSLNYAKIALDNLDDEVKKNEKYLEEAKQSTDGCASSIDKYGKEAKQAAQETENVSQKSSRLQDIFKGALGADLVSKGFSFLIGKAKELWNALWGLEEQTREYRMDLSHLETNALRSGNSVEQMKQHMIYLASVTGETDSSVEALSNLMKTGFSDAQMVDVVKELSGAVVAFPDTLKIESLSDSLQETVATGKGVGQFSELLERSGLKLDAFNNEMADAASYSEKLNIAIRYLARTGMSEFADSFAANNEALLKLQKAEADLQDTQAAMGGSMVGAKASWAEFLDSLLNSIPAFKVWRDNIYDAKDVVESTVVPVTELKNNITSLTAEFDAAKIAVETTLEGIIKGWEAAPEVVATSADEILANLQSQLDWMTNYRENLDELMSRQIPGVDTTALVQSLSDGSNESAAILAGLKDATDEQVAQIAASLGKVTDGKEAFSSAVGAAAVDYDSRMAQLVQTATKSVLDMDLSDEAKKSALNTIDGYIIGVNKQSGPLNLAMTNAAKAALNAWKRTFDEHSPSKEMERSGENAMKGEILGVQAMEGEVAQTFEDAGYKMMENLAVGMTNSKDKVMETMDDVAAELKARVKVLTDGVGARLDISELQQKIWKEQFPNASELMQNNLDRASLQQQLELQAEDVRIKTEAYENMALLTGKGSAESLAQYKQLLQARLELIKLQKDLEELQSFEQADPEALASLAEQKYKLWYAENENTTDTEKMAMWAGVLTEKYELQEASVADAEAALRDMINAQGEGSAESVKLTEQLLKEKTALAELRAEIKELGGAYAEWGVGTLPNTKVSTDLSPLRSATSIASTSQASAASMIAQAVNAMTGAAGNVSMKVEVPVNLNGREVARVITPEIRALEKSSPEVRSDNR